MAKQIFFQESELPTKIKPVGNSFKDISEERFGSLVALYPCETGRSGVFWICKCDCGSFIKTLGVSLRKGLCNSCSKCGDKKFLGYKFGRLLVLDVINNNKIKKYKCLCDCGKITIVNGYSLKSGETKSCGCLSGELTSKRNRVEIINGSKFGRLTVIEETKERSGTHIKYLCSCECGTQVVVSGYNLRTARTQSCGCLTSKGEELISNVLEKNNILFQKQFGFKDLINIRHLKFDFAILNNDLTLSHLIEYDGIQHFELVERFGGQKGFEERKGNDEIKNKYCRDNNIKLIRIKYNQKINLKDLL